MTRQQARVSAAAVEKLVEIALDRLESFDFVPAHRLTRKLVLEELLKQVEALLATAPPEQAVTLPAKLTLEHITTALDYASEGRNWSGVKPDLLGNQLNRVLARLADEVPIIHGQAELAAHDQKVRAETLAGISERLLAKAFPMTPYGEAEGCVTLADLNAELRAVASGAVEKK